MNKIKGVEQLKNVYIQKVKQRLRKYKDLQAQHRILMKRYLTAGDPYANMSMNYNSIAAGSRTYSTSSRIENAIIKSDERITEHSEALQEIEELDIALDALTTQQRQIIKRKYVNRESWEIISEKLGYSVAHCKREGKKGLIRMADILYGAKSYYDLPLYNIGN